jgi:hypothetical protein
LSAKDLKPRTVSDFRNTREALLRVAEIAA